MGFFDKAKQAGDLLKLRKQAKEVEKKLKNIHVEAEENGIVVVVSAKMEMISVTIPPEMTDTNIIATSVVNATNKAMKKAQTVSAQEMQAVMGAMGLGGMMGGGE